MKSHIVQKIRQMFSIIDVIKGLFHQIQLFKIDFQKKMKKK